MPISVLLPTLSCATIHLERTLRANELANHEVYSGLELHKRAIKSNYGDKTKKGRFRQNATCDGN